MPNGHGGYRRPSQPAAVSGPGAYSQRTDGAPHAMQVTGQSYGENGATNALQTAAPMAAPTSAPAPLPPPTPPTGLADPSAYPDQPVTAGAAAGAGVGPADIGLQQDQNHELRQALGPMAPVFMRMADSSYATPTFKRQVRQLLARLNS